MFSRCTFGGPGGRPTHCDSLLQDKDDSTSGGSWQARPNQHQKIWILDVDGDLVMIMAGSSADASQQDRAALDEIVASIQIG